MKKRPSRSLNYQTLEPRQVLAANPLLTLDAGTLTIEGTASADIVKVSQAGKSDNLFVEYQTDNQKSEKSKI